LIDTRKQFAEKATKEDETENSINCVSRNASSRNSHLDHSSSGEGSPKLLL
jgi:hypothetical protein